ncbi:DNA primase [Streptomyces phaeoluteigriseus]|uniref:DNA primase n=1 Tax=Streptomyces phaeoluteigriseus TaxID=114686 RepID=A0A1V6MM96_9ACTN|nr:DNA primase [Streptomyces phaeoluteigriseus]OQD53581.1 DNA primase [Streptomyces phaeoluteigriseus]
MNRVGLGLALGAGYVLGRTKKMKLALAVGSMVAGKRLNLTPRGVADLVSQQLKDNPQFKQIGDELRQDLRGVGKAASGAMVERQINALADRLHSRTGQVRDQLEGVVPGGGGDKDEEEDDREASEEYDEPESGQDDGVDEDEDQDQDEDQDEDQDATEEQEDQEEQEEQEERPRKKAPAKKAAKKAPAKTAPAKKTAAPARKTAAKTASRAPRPKGGGE